LPVKKRRERGGGNSEGVENSGTRRQTGRIWDAEKLLAGEEEPLLSRGPFVNQFPVAGS